MNNTDPPHIQFVKKPIYTAMGLLSLLGDEYMDAEISDPLITIAATRSQISATMTLVIVYANSTAEGREDPKNITAVLRGIEGPDTRYVVYLLDNVQTNPFSIWKAAGSPVFPSRELRAKMRNVEVSLELEQVFVWFLFMSKAALKSHREKVMKLETRPIRNT